MQIGGFAGRFAVTRLLSKALPGRAVHHRSDPVAHILGPALLSLFIGVVVFIRIIIVGDHRRLLDHEILLLQLLFLDLFVRSRGRRGRRSLFQVFRHFLYFFHILHFPVLFPIEVEQGRIGIGHFDGSKQEDVLIPGQLEVGIEGNIAISVSLHDLESASEELLQQPFELSGIGHGHQVAEGLTIGL